MSRSGVECGKALLNPDPISVPVCLCASAWVARVGIERGEGGKTHSNSEECGAFQCLCKALAYKTFAAGSLPQAEASPAPDYLV
eukprot:1159511-Pelagomonas_calceolata.AAC.8